MTGHLDDGWGVRGLFRKTNRQERDRKRRTRRRELALTPLKPLLEQLEARVLLTNQPDLVITAASAPGSAVEGNASKIAISWTVKNEGTAPAAGQWYDAVYLSANGVIDKNSVSVDSLDEMFHGPLAVGATYTVSRAVTLPEFALGNQSLIFRADDGNAFGDAGTSGNTNLQTIDLTAPNVNLAVTGATLSSSSVVGGDGQQIDVSWTVQNKGTDPAAAGWKDEVYVSTKSTLDSTATPLWYSYPATPLAAGGSYTSHAAITMPDLTAGQQYYLIFSTNDNHGQGESDQASDTDNTLAKQITATSPGSVDLAVSNVTVNGSSSQQTAVEGNGQLVTVGYTVTNNGTAAANAQWTDAVYLSSKNTLDSSATELGELSPPSTISGLPRLPLAAGASYSNTDSVTIPQWATGTEYLLIETDNGDVQSETSKANNLVAVPITLTSPNVDLKVTSATANVASAVAGNEQSVTVMYTVKNAGTDPAQGSWDDAIYLSSKSTYDSSATLLRSIYQFSDLVPKSLAAGASYTVSQTVTLPDFAAVGSDFLLVRTNVGEGGADIYTQAETDQANDMNNLASVPITLTAPNVNLAISASAATTPPTTPLTVEAGNGQQLNLAWTVTNNGTADANTTWTDNVVLANDANYDPAAISLATTTEAGLPAGASYTENRTAMVPNMPAGNRDLVFVTDQNDNQSETQKTDNLVAQPIVVTTPNVDLAISGTAPSSAIEGGSVPVTWTVTNNGSEAAKGTWSDAVYLSDDPTLDDTSVRLTSVAAPTDAGLTAGHSYTLTANVTIPASTTGQHYLLFVANDGRTQGETNYANDVTAVPVTLTAPDLKLQSANVTPSSSGTVVEGAQTSVSWTVLNNSTVAAPATWYDSVFVSDQPNFDSSTKYVTSFYEGAHAGLAATYTDSEIIDVPQFPTGTAYLLFVTDFAPQYYGSYGAFQHAQPQSDSTGQFPDSNDLQAVQVTLAAPRLSVTTASLSSPTGVEGGTVNVSWTTKNVSPDTAMPSNYSWEDAVYLSSKPTFDSRIS